MHLDAMRGEKPRPEFDSVDELLSFVRETPVQWKNAPYVSSKNPPDDWSGNVTFDGAVDLGYKGWPEGRAKIVKTLDAAAYLQQNAVRPSINFDVAGAYPIVPLAVAGDPASMVDLGDVSSQARPIVRIWLNVGASAGVHEKHIINRGTAILSHIDRLENEGKSVELTLVWTAFTDRGGGDGKGLITKIVVKRAGEPLEIDRLAFVLGHPGFMRRVLFRLLETTPDLQVLSGSYGFPHDIKRADIEPGVIYFPSLFGGRGTMYGDLSNLADALKKIGQFIDDNVKGNIGLAEAEYTDD
jgi:hypothetical protein